jgi:hypothetical protein
VTTRRLERNLRTQADACRELGSPFYAVLLEHAADDLGNGGPVAEVLAGHEDRPGPWAAGLRLLGTVHRMVLAGDAPALAATYPDGGTGDPEEAWPVLRDLLAARRDAVREGMVRAPQTNEVGRAAVLVGGLLHVAAETGLPVRLWEIGASGGLNLRADRFRVESVDGSVGWGPPDSPVRLRAWQGVLPPCDAALRVVERVGCDLAPVDPLTDDGRLTLASYVWPDDTARVERLHGALEVARAVPATVEASGATDLLGRAALQDGTVLVVWHSVMWQYLEEGERAAVTHRLEALGAGATPGRPLAHLSFEPRRHREGEPWVFTVALRLWPGGERRVLGEAAPHGVPVTWSGRG